MSRVWSFQDGYQPSASVNDIDHLSQQGLLGQAAPKSNSVKQGDPSDPYEEYYPHLDLSYQSETYRDDYYGFEEGYDHSNFDQPKFVRLDEKRSRPNLSQQTKALSVILFILVGLMMAVAMLVQIRAIAG